MKVSKLWKAPSDLGDHGRRLWRSVGPHLVETGSLDELDRPSFEVLCRTYDRMVTADLQLKEEGLVVEGLNNTTKKHPAFAIWKSYSDLYVKLSMYFGLTPHGRGEKVKSRNEEKENGKDHFFK